MPVSKKRKKAERRQPAEGGGGGIMSRMRGGIRDVAGAGPKKKDSLLSQVLTWALVLLAAFLLARRFGILR